MRTPVLWAMIAMIVPLAACQSKWERERTAEASGGGATRSYGASGFTGVALRGSDDVDVTQGAAFSVTAEGDPRVLDQLEISVADGTLRIGRKSSTGWNWSGDGARVHVVMPRLERASVGGSGNLMVAQAEGDFTGAVSGSGDLDVKRLNGGAATLSIAGSGRLTIAGTATALTADVAGSGDIDAEKLNATSGKVSIAGSGDVNATVAGPATVSIVGSGDATLGGGAQCTISKMGSGEARCS